MSSSSERPYVVVMAGGAGTRFWPLSRRARPKQLLPFASGRSLLAATVARVLPLAGADRTFVVTGAAISGAVRAELPSLPAENVLVEPVGRDTAACVGWMAWRLAAEGRRSVMVVLPADHAVADGAALLQALSAAAACARERSGLVTLGIRPTRPETGFGYLELGETVGQAGGLPLVRVARFVEKPGHDDASAMLASGRFLWNAGMFAWTLGDVEDEIRRSLPALADGLDRMMADARRLGEDEAVRRHYAGLPRLSIDYGIMEKASSVWVLPLDLAWSDVGSWAGLAEAEGDASGGVRLGDVLALDSDGAVLVSEGPMIAVVGVPDLVVVATRDAVLVVPKDQAQRVKEIVAALEAKGRSGLL